MHSRFRAKGVALAVLAALVALLALPGTSLAKPKPGVTGRGFRLQARAIGAITINRVYCGLSATGEVCVDSTNSSTIGGGYWPKGSPQQYVFNSGLQAAGAIAGTNEWAWAGDTTGAFFFDPKGTTQHGQLVQPIWNSASPADVAAWPQAARVPQGDAVADLFAADLQGRVSASQGDVWTVAWDGDPSLIAGRPHPLGIAVETRGLGWNYPTGNNDIVYFIYTFYNVTSSCAADYAAIRPGMRELMQGLGNQFQSLNNAAFGITIPACGYTIDNFYANFAADMDVSSDAGNNYSSVNLPFSLGYVYEDTFRRTEGTYRLPPDAGGAPFTGGYGFVGVKYLKSPIDPNTGEEAGIRLFSNTVNGSSFNDPQNVQQMYRYISGNISPALGDGLCNYSPTVDRICFVKADGHADMRFFQSSGPFSLAPGQFGSIVVGYVFASAVSVAGCPAPGCASVLPGNPRRLSDAASLASGANLIDSLTGFRGYTDGSNGNPLDNEVQQGEIRTVRGSLLNKALVAQSVFDSKFLLPSAPEAPEFFLVPGDNSVAIFWRPTATEATGDVFFSAANNPASLLYDPNYRQYDVEGYRIYRGRVDDPSALTLLAQYDYAGTSMRDYLAAVNPTPTCAPELGLSTNAGGACPVNYGPVPPAGSPYTVFTTVDVVSPFIQVKIGNRTLLANNNALVLTADTAVTGLESGAHPEMANTGVPFVYVDNTAKNNLRYFYAVTAFDVNSVQSGPTSLESSRSTKSATPVAPGSNYDNSGSLDIGMFGRGVNMSAAIPAPPGINSATGVFTGPARPATGAQLGFVGQLVAQVVTQSGQMTLTLDSMQPGSAYDGAAATFWFRIISAAGTVPTTITVVQDVFNGSVHSTGTIDGGPIDGERASRYGGSTDYHLAGAYDLEFVGNYYTASFGRGCVNAAPGFRSGACNYNGARWFDGAAETFPHPTRGNNVNFSNAPVTNPTTAGSLTNVANVYEARSYQTRPNTYRAVEGVLGTVATAADYRLYWGAGGTVDSVVDITHNVQVPFRADMNRGYTWGFLTQAAASAVGSGDVRPGVLTVTDFGCVEPLRSRAASDGHLGCGGAGTGNGPVYSLVSTVAFGPLAYGNTVGTDNTAPATTNQGFGIYLAGHIFLIEMNSATPTAPAAGTVWTMRSYTGAISGGGGSVGTGGNQGAYSFQAVPSPFTAVGASLTAAYSVTNALRQATESDLDAVHTVPDPYYVTNAYESSPSGKQIKFVNLPSQAIIRIYSTSGVLVRVLEHNSSQFGGQETWDVRNRNNQVVASGVYFYHIEAPSGARRVGRMTIVNFAQ